MTEETASESSGETRVNEESTGRDQHEKPGLVDVFAGSGGNLGTGGATLHRVDMESRCSTAPDYPNTKTDLITAAVPDGHSLCGNCDWPDGAEEVLEE